MTSGEVGLILPMLGAVAAAAAAIGTLVVAVRSLTASARLRASIRHDLEIRDKLTSAAERQALDESIEWQVRELVELQWASRSPKYRFAYASKYALALPSMVLGIAGLYVVYTAATKELFDRGPSNSRWALLQSGGISLALVVTAVVLIRQLNVALRRTRAAANERVQRPTHRSFRQPSA